MMRVKSSLFDGMCLTILACAWPLMSIAGAINLPQTGQTICYDAAGNVIACAGTGQDGDVQAGVAWPEPRFVDNDDGTITDHLTGLIWLKNANCFSRNWPDALGVSNSLAGGSCGLTDGSEAGDWRLPNIVELESLVNTGASDLLSWLISQGFTEVQLAFYWSASTNWNYTGGAWALSTGSGSVTDITKSLVRRVWPVRGGE